MLRPDSRAPARLRSHLTNDVRFSVPADWEDRSVHVLVAVPGAAPPGGEGGATDGAAAFSVTLHRDRPQPGEDLAAYVARQMAALEGAIKDLDVLRQGPRAVGGLPGWEAEVRWIGPQGRLRQHQVQVLRDGPDGPRVLTWTATALATQYLNYADQFAALLDSVRFVAPSLALSPVDDTAPGRLTGSARTE